MARFISLIISIIVLILVFRFIWFILPYALIIGFLIFVYYKWVRPLFKTNKSSKLDDLYDNNNYYGKNDDKEDDLFNGTIVDVEYKDVDEDNNKKDIL